MSAESLSYTMDAFWLVQLMVIYWDITKELCVMRGSQAYPGLRGIERLDLTSTKARESDLKNREGVPWEMPIFLLY